MNRRSAAVLLVPLLAIGGCTSSGATGAAAAASTTDAGFVKTAYQDDLAEELAGENAATQAGSSQVKAFASRMLSDHDNMAVGLQQVATRQGMTVSASPDDAQLARINAMATSTDAAFDRAYVASEISRLQTMVQAYSTEASSGQNAAVRQYASDRLPVVQLHLKDAEALPKG